VPFRLLKLGEADFERERVPPLKIKVIYSVVSEILVDSYVVIPQSRVATIVIITDDFIFFMTYRRGTGEREYGERDRLPPRRRSRPTGEPLR
jgi:hypothetical protein